MNLDNIFNNKNEKPLDTLAQNGGYTSIFRTIACIGDSLSSGEFKSEKSDGSSGYHDFFEYSWGQFLGRMCQSKVYNFSRGGMTAREYVESFSEAFGFWNPSLASQCYIIAFGINDLSCEGAILGGIEDFNREEPSKSNKTFAGFYMQIIAHLKKIQPRAKFFLVTMPDADDSEYFHNMKKAHREFLYELSRYFDNTYVIDLFKYAPKYDAAFCEKFYLRGHLNPLGYKLTADIIGSYIDYIIRHNPDDFKEVAFIGTDLHG